MTDSRRFFIVGMQRSGTTVTQVCLSGHPDVSMPGDEVLASPFFTVGLATFTKGKEPYESRALGYQGLFDLIATYLAKRPSLAHGFKVAVGNHAEALDVCNCIRDFFPDARVVLVSRDDLVAQCGSMALATKSGEWHAWEGQKRTEAGKIELPVAAFDRYAKDCRRAVAQLRTLARTHEVLDFGYETHIDGEFRHDVLFDFIGVPRVDVTWMRMEKLAPPPRDFITNYDALRARLAAMPEVDEASELAAAKERRRELSRDLDANFLLSRACASLEARGDLVEATYDLNLALQGKPDLWLRAWAYALFEERTEGSDATLLDRIAGLEADNPYFLVERGNRRQQRGRAAEAYEDCRAALDAADRLDPIRREHAFAVLERTLVALQNADKALRTIDELRGRFEGELHFHVLAGVVYLGTGRIEEARDAFRKAVAIEPGHARGCELLERCEQRLAGA